MEQFKNFFKIISTVIFKFPIEIVYAGIFTITMFIYSGNYSYLTNDLLQNVLMISVLGFFINLGISLLFIKNKLNNSIKYLLYLIVMLLLFAYYYTLPSSIIDFISKTYIIYFIILFCSILSMFFLPYIMDKRNDKFWLYSFSVIKSAFISALYGFVIFVGLSIVLLSLDYLFGVNIQGEYYIQLWSLVVGLFMSIFFIGNINLDNNEIEIQDYSNKYLLILGKYILFGLTVIYLVILYTYGLKILFTGVWPNGMVVLLIFWYSVIGISHYLLMRGFGQTQENKKLLELQMKVFFFSMIPLIGLYYYALLIRINDYGYTVNRVFVIFYGIFLISCTSWFIAKKYFNPKSILYLGFLISIISIIGPWSVFNISINSQISVLENIMEKNGILVNGKIQALEKDTLDEETKERIYNILDYVLDYHGKNKLKYLFNIDGLETNSNSKYYYGRNEDVQNLMKQMGLNLKYGLDVVNNVIYHFQGKQNGVLQIGGYSYMLNIELYNKGNDKDTIYESKNGLLKGLNISFDFATNKISIVKDEAEIQIIEMQDKLLQLIKENELNYYTDLDNETLTLILNGYKLIIKDIQILKQENNIQVQSLKGYILLPENL